jgi:translocation and assembly module TamB
VKKRRFLITSALAGATFFLLGLLISSQIPKARSWILVKIEEESRVHLPVRVLPGSLEVSLFPLGATLSNVRVLPKKETEDYIDNVGIDSIRISISLWQLLQGKLRITDLLVSGAVVTAKVPAPKTGDEPPLAGLFEIVSRVPASKLILEDVALRLKLTEPAFIVNADGVSLIAEKKRGGALLLDLGSASVQVIDPEIKASMRITTEARLLLARTSVSILQAAVRRGESYFSISGKLDGDTEALTFTEVDLKSEAELQIESMRNWAVRTFKKLKDVPETKGRAALEAKLRKSKSSPLEGDFKIKTRGLRIDDLHLDKLHASGTYKNRDVRVPVLSLENPSGQIFVNDLRAEIGESQNPKLDFSGKLSTSRIQLHELLKTVGVGEIPVYLQMSTDIPCIGSLTPKFQISCRGKIRTENLLVRDAMNSKSTIVAVRELNADGEVTIDTDKVVYKADLSAPNSKGRSQGEIVYSTGFKIGFEADKLLFADIANLADLKIEGSTRLKGVTQGDSLSAIFSMDLEASDAWIDDFWLGSFKSTMSYKSGLLTFNGIQGHYNVSRYAAELKLDLYGNQIEINGRAPFIESRDLLKAFSRKVSLPFSMSGTGQASVKASGPLDFSRLTYELRSSLFKGTIAGETYDQAHFDVKSLKGEVTTERVQLIKGASTMTLSGTARPDGTMKAVLLASGIRLEDSAMVAASGLAVSGVLDFDMNLSGPILQPDTDLRGSLSKTTVGDQAVPDSSYQLKFMPRTIEGEGVFLGNVLKSEFIIPLDANAPFSLKLTSREWNFAPLFAAISGTSTRKDFEGRLTSDIEISSPSGGFWNSSGNIKVDKFSLARGNLALRSTEPLSMTMKNGSLHVQKFDLAGDNVFLKVSESPNPMSKVDLQVNGKLDLTLISLLTPFFEDLRGILSFAFNLRAGPSSLDLLGSAYVERGFLKFFEFPHPLENISADLLFNQRKILFNTLKAEFGGGRILANGGMELKGYKSYPVNVSGSFEKVTLNVPDKVRTSGSGSVSFTGEWFPFLLKVEYDIREGLMTKEFGGDGEQFDGIRRDFFLPELILADSFTPLLVDLDIRFNRGIAVKNDLVEGRVTGSLSVKGRPEKPAISGLVATDKETRIFFKDTPFEVTSGNLEFDGSTDINPKLYLAGRSRVQEYDINLMIQGTAGKPEIALSTIPPLPKNDIISLLALGATDTQLSKSITSNEQASSSATQIGAGVIRKNPISDLVKDKLGFDVQFSPGFDETGSSAVQKIIVSRQFNPRFGVTASRSIGKIQETEARARYRLNDKLSLVGSWQGRDYTEGTDQTQADIQTPNKFGLDIEYKFEFK